nr:phosphatase PAP2 family protein [Flexivirga aerilata]
MAAIPDAKRPTVLGEILVGAALFAVYLLVDALRGPGRTAWARDNAAQLIDLERWLHLDVERGLNDWLAARPGLMTAANYEYATTYLVSAALLLVISYLWAPQVYRQARNSFVLLNLLAFAAFAAYPLMPPRMMPGFVDTVASGGTVGSWGSPVVAGANQLAAMPSLHMAWALWVSVMLARMSQRRWLQAVSAVHVLLTLYVVLATANHYVLDAAGAVVVVGVAVGATARLMRGSSGRLPTADAFFLDIETPGNGQNVGGLALIAGSPTYDEIRGLLERHLPQLPHFTDRLAGVRGAARWEPAGAIDWSHHLVEVELPAGSEVGGSGVGGSEVGGPSFGGPSFGGPSFGGPELVALDELVGRLTTPQLPQDRPLWRAWLVRGVRGGTGFCIVMHHCMADGVGAVAKLLCLLEPPYELPVPDRKGPGAVQRGAGVVAGLAQLATDGRPAAVLATGGSARGFATAEVPLDAVRDAARSRGMKVTELLLAATGSAVAGVDPGLASRCGGRLRVSVPMMLRAPGSGDDDGNLTAAVLLDTPARGASIDELRDEVCRKAAPLRSPTRALASRWVMASALRAVPRTGRRAFARNVYGPKYFQAIVSNMPGPDRPFTMAGLPVGRVLPILPPAPGIPLTVGALSWDGHLGITVVTDAAVLDARAVVERLEARLLEPVGVVAQ